MLTTNLKFILLVAILFLCDTDGFGQKYMVKANDTLPYQLEMDIQNADTVYLGTCHSFEIINGRLVNQTDEQCLQQGLWIISDSLGNYRKGELKNSKSVGVWQYYYRNNRLLKEEETVTTGRDTYTVKEIDYASGKAVVIVDKPMMAFYLKNLLLIWATVFVCFFSRVFLNSKIYNTENGTNFSPVYFYFGPLVTKNFGHSLLCTYTFWFFNYKPENRKLVLISNTLSVISLGLFFGILAALMLAGEI